ncbi:MAG: phosphotriesterase-related protein [SAR202 cluster bacterium]|nr:phosphotriesterase-related protein [SAR202 cluster bacterium]
MPASKTTPPKSKKKPAPSTRSGRALSGKVQTVLGPIDPSELGITLMHEHLVISLEAYSSVAEDASTRHYAEMPIKMENLGKHAARRYFTFVDVKMYDVREATEEVLKFKHAGGGSLVDTTSQGIGRDPLALARISRATGLNIVMGASWYVPIFHPADMDKWTEDQIAKQIIGDVTVGVKDTGIKSGIIGEVGNFYPMSPNERKILRASAMAQVETGAPITIHPGFDERSPMQILETLVKAGADPKHVVIGHLCSVLRDRGAIRELAQSGCYMEYDGLGSFEDTSHIYRGMTDTVISDVQRMDILDFLAGNGHIKQILPCHDVCLLTHFTRYGGRGYAFLLESIVPRLRKRGWTEAQLQTILVDNPARALTFA